MTIIKKFEPEEIKKVFSKKYICFIAASFLILMIFEIWVSNNMVTYGEKFDKLSSVAKTLALENQILENEIARTISLNEVASKSAELGFSQPQSIQYIR